MWPRDAFGARDTKSEAIKMSVGRRTGIKCVLAINIEGQARYSDARRDKLKRNVKRLCVCVIVCSLLERYYANASLWIRRNKWASECYRRHAALLSLWRFCRVGVVIRVWRDWLAGPERWALRNVISSSKKFGFERGQTKDALNPKTVAGRKHLAKAEWLIFSAGYLHQRIFIIYSVQTLETILMFVIAIIRAW